MGKNDNKQRLLEMMGKLDPTFKPRLNEDNGAFNDAGEPIMTHQQYRDYSEPSEPEYDDSNNYEREQTSDDVVKAIEKHFDTILETYGNKEYSFMTKGADGDLMLWFENNQVGAIGIDNKKFEQQYIEELDVNELIQFLEPYRQYMLTGAEAEKQMEIIYKQNAADTRYANQEKAAMGGIGENLNNDKILLNMFIGSLPDNFPELVRQYANDKNIGLDSAYYQFIGAFSGKFEKNNAIEFNLSDDDLEELNTLMYGKFGDNAIEF